MRRLLFLSLLPLVPSAFAGEHAEDKSLLWGTYRPNLYFGLRPRLPHSLMAGLMWFGLTEYNHFSQIRHSCEQGDGLDGYTWTEYDPREGGVQTLKDSKNNVELRIEWLKVPGGDHGGSWAARIKGQPMKQSSPSRNSFLFYFGLEGLGALKWNGPSDANGFEGPAKLSGSSPDLGEFRIRIEDGSDNTPIIDGIHATDFSDRHGKTHFTGVVVPDGQVWQAKQLIQQEISKFGMPIMQNYKDSPPDPTYILALPNKIAPGSNFFAVQKFYSGAFEFDIIFESASAKQPLSASTLNSGIPAFTDAFTRRFEATFPFPSASPSEYLPFSKAISSNLLGGIGYFYGQSIVDRTFKQEWDDEVDAEDEDEARSTQAKPELETAKGLLTATPSRPFFPRGFYWDEGFHLLLVGAWDNDLSLEILRDWINLIDENGWVGREQILGDEARSKVPEEFQAQYPSYANPPTLTMAVTAFISRLREQGDSGDIAMGMNGAQATFSTSEPSPTAEQASRHLTDKALAISYLKSIYPPLLRHYDWFRSTQKGLIKQYSRKPRSRTEAYRWRGRSKDHVLTSGMDDYPRAPPHVGELHLDLISWMAFFTRTMKDIADFLDEKDDVAKFSEIETAILGNIEDLHWSEDKKMYCDVGVNEDEESYHSCDAGYLSLFPFILGLLPPDSPHLGAILDIVHSPDHLWSPYGIRSLSKSHPLFGQGENYWRGPIWIQMNYLALSALHKTYAALPGPNQVRARQIYTELRDNIIKNVYKEYERTGYVWEQYDPATGEGKRSHPFTGWTSLVTLIIAEKYY